MLLLKLIILTKLVTWVIGSFSYTSWSSSFGHEGQSMCSGYSQFMTGIKRSAPTWYDPLNNLQGTHCCSAPSHWTKLPMHVIYANWKHNMTQYEVGAHCPAGYYMQGLYRSETGFPWYSGYLYNIEQVRCSRPVTHPFHYDHCYHAYMSECLQKAGDCSCDEGYYLTGLYKAKGDGLRDLKYFYCCSMAKKSQRIKDPETLQMHVMDITFNPLVNLADRLGYAWPYGRKGLYLGDDFVRKHDRWEAGTDSFSSNEDCLEPKCHERLSIIYDNWNLNVKEIAYGKSVTDELLMEDIDGGEIENKGTFPMTHTFEVSRSVEETITHSSTSSWTNSHQLGVSLRLKVKGKSGEISYTYKNEASSSITRTNLTTTSMILKAQTSTTVAPNETSMYTVKLRKNRVTIPYTAVITAHFSVQFNGFLISSGDSKTNYHYMLNVSKAYPTFNFKLGDDHVPFYKALHMQSKANSEPWQWNNMFIKYTGARSRFVEKLTEEKQYLIELRGIIEQVTGTTLVVSWGPKKADRLKKRSIKTRKVQSVNGTILALPGPNDKRAKVEYPHVI